MKNGLVIDRAGTKIWYVNGKYHKEDGPAVDYKDNVKYWCKYGKNHRFDGPAIENFQGKNDWTYWYYDGIEYDKENHPFNVFRKERMLSEIYNDWPADMKMLFKLTYGGI